MSSSIFQAKGPGDVDLVTLDVHAIAELRDKGLPATDDAPKYDYRPKSDDPDAEYEFDSCQARVVAIRSKDKSFADSVAEESGLCGLILDKTSFYPEAGGQIFDTGYMIKSGDDDSVEFCVENVQSRGGYALHVGKVSGSGKISVGDTVSLFVDTQRRKLVMNNHTGTHVLNFALRQVLGPEADQRGSLVAPDRLRFDFTNKGAMSVPQVRLNERANFYAHRPTT
jgi:alanyl-tRNA synthetase